MLGFSERCNVDEAVLGSVSGDLVDLPVVFLFFFVVRLGRQRHVLRC